MASKINTLLLLHWRNFGDAVIGLGLVEAFRAAQPHVQIDVLTRPQTAFLYQNHPSVRSVYTASFPVGTVQPFTVRDGLRLAAELLRARRRRYDAVANLFGDVRENAAGRLICPRGNYSLVWPEGHPVRMQSRIGPASLLSHPVVLPPRVQSVYEAMGHLSAALGANAPATPCIYGPDKQPMRSRPITNRIGLHVSAGQECRRWPLDRWRELAARLLDEGSELRIYCAPGERTVVASGFAPLLASSGRIELVARSIEDFLRDAATCGLFIGLDSFGIHAAAALGVPCILVNGANVAEVWAPPGTVILHGDEALSCFPCYNKPTCAPGSGQYACIRSVPVDALHRLVRLSPLSRDALPHNEPHPAR